MKRSIFIFVATAFIIFAFPLFARGEVEATGDTAAAQGGPQYGGTFTWAYTATATAGPGNADMTTGNWYSYWYSSPFSEWLVIGDFEKYGPRGTNEFAFESASAVDEPYLKGGLAESWELSAGKIVFHIRQGVMWAGREGVMDPREFTAHDAAFHLKRWLAGSAGKGTSPEGWVESIAATDNYTLVVETSTYNPMWFYLTGYGPGLGIIPEEVVKADATDWMNSVGTGPFMVTDYVEGSYMTYEKNPNWWDKTHVIDGKEYDLPFIDKMVWPIIPDEGTQVASLRTGKIDAMSSIKRDYEETLADTSPELVKKKLSSRGVTQYAFNTAIEPWNNPEVRRAFMIGTDFQAIYDALYPGANLYDFPVVKDSPGVYPEWDELPESTQMLFDYNPTLAARMLRDEGIPEGFEMELMIVSEGASPMIKEMWEKLGVKVNIKVVEQAAQFNVIWTEGHAGHNGVVAAGSGQDFPYRVLQRYGSWHIYNYPNYIDDHAAELYAKASAMDITPAERNAIMKEQAKYLLDQAICVPISGTYSLYYWWPWVKNFHGEINVGYVSPGPILATVWLDQDMKAEMGYK